MSITGTEDEVAQMIVRAEAASTRPAAIEINLSCPNISGHPPPCYDAAQMTSYMTTVSAAAKTIPVGLKLAPFLYDQQFHVVANAIRSCSAIRFVIAINTIGNGLMVDVDKDVFSLSPGGPFGGLGGKAVHSLALGNVLRLRQVLPSRVDIIGCGGVDSGEAAYRFLACGASAVEVATQLLIEGPSVFARINRELMQIMQRKGFSSIQDIHRRWHKSAQPALTARL